MMDFMFSIDLFWASSAPGGRVTKVPVVWDSSVHPHTRHTDASTVGTIRLPIKNDVALERIWHLTIVVSSDGPGTFTTEDSHLGHLSGAGLHLVRIDESMPATGEASIESDCDWTLAE